MQSVAILAQAWYERLKWLPILRPSSCTWMLASSRCGLRNSPLACRFTWYDCFDPPVEVAAAPENEESEMELEAFQDGSATPPFPTPPASLRIFPPCGEGRMGAASA